MRKIEFRAWDKKEKIMYPWPFIVHYFDDEIRVTKLDRSDFKRIPMTDIELMQFTGLKDKNWREIYEGDIVLCLNKDAMEKWYPKGRGIIQWDDWMVAFAYMEPDFNLMKEKKTESYIGSSIGIQGASGRWWEVIGNIHENPELLEKDK